jgi:S-adenosylmethionine hydrolase
VGEPLITFLSDYGHAEEFVGVCHGVIAGRCPRARVIDISHSIPRHDVRTGALVLRDALAHIPPAVHLAVVDPTVGASGPESRRAVALATATADQVLVGPDNGLLWLAAERLGGVAEAVDIGRSPERREPVSATFHGRDVFAPVAAALAAGTPLRSVGEPFATADVRPLTLPCPHVESGLLAAHVLRSDAFGNLILDASAEHFNATGIAVGDEVSVEVRGRSLRGRRGVAFADVEAGALLLYEDASGSAALAVNLGSAARELGVGRDEELLVRRA